MVAAVAGGVYWLLQSDLDTIFDTVGLENKTEEEDGSTTYVYVDTSEVSTVKELVSALQDIAGKDSDTLTIGDFTSILPIANNLVDVVYSAFADVLNLTEDEVHDLIDEDTLKSTPISGIMDYLRECLYNLDVDQVLGIAGIDVESSNVYLAIAYGSPAGTITVNGVVYVLYSEDLDADGDDYYITASGDQLDGSYTDYVYSAGNSCKLYYYVSGGTAYVVQRNSYDEEVRYSAVTDSSDGNLVYTQYNASTATYSGAYCYIGGNLTVLSERTLNDLVNEGIDDMFYDLYITDFMTDDADPILLEALDGISLGELLNGDTYASDILYDILITDMFEDDADEVLFRLFDGITIGDIMTGETTMEELMDKLYIPDILDTEAEESIAAFISYSVTNVTALSQSLTLGGDVVCNYTATLHIYTEESGTEADNAYDAYLAVDESGYITGVWYYGEDNTLCEYSGVAVGDIESQISRLMDTLTIGDIIDTEGSTILQAISGSTINSLSEDIKNLTVQELFYDDIYSQAEAVNNTTYGTVEGYLKVVYESLPSGGTYYSYTAADDTLTQVTDTSYTNLSAYLSEGTLYWSDGSGTVYNVVEFSYEYLYYEYTNGSLGYVEYESELGHLSAYSSFTGSGILYTYGEPQNAWYFMLNQTVTDSTSGEEVSYEKAYTVDEIGELVTNATNSIQHSTLNKLIETGLLTNETLAENAHKVISLPGSEHDGETLGDLTLYETIDLFMEFMALYLD